VLWVVSELIKSTTIYTCCILITVFCLLTMLAVITIWCLKGSHRLVCCEQQMLVLDLLLVHILSTDVREPFAPRT
jgi:hypothetical protein